MPNLLELVHKAESARKQKQTEAQTQTQETARLERELVEQISAAVANAVAEIDLTPLVPKPEKPIDLSPHFKALADEVKRARFVDKTPDIEKAIQAFAKQVVGSVERAVSAIPRTNVAPILDEVKRAIGGLVMPEQIFVTKWKHDVIRDSHGNLESVESTAQEWGTYEVDQ